MQVKEQKKTEKSASWNHQSFFFLDIAKLSYRNAHERGNHATIESQKMGLRKNF